MALGNLGEAGSEYAAGLSFLIIAPTNNTDYLARQVAAMARAGLDVTRHLGALLAAQTETDPYGINGPEGGWGVGPGYSSDVLDTSLALDALRDAGVVDSLPTAQNAIGYLVAAQNSEGGWGLRVDSDSSNTYFTARALLTLAMLADLIGLQNSISQGSWWLRERQNEDGGWGEASSTVSETAVAHLALRRAEPSAYDPTAATRYLLDSQSPDGSWNGSAYDTASAILALSPDKQSFEVYLPLSVRP
jgi:hypothetical protein